MTYVIDRKAQIAATRELARQVRRMAALISLDVDRARLLAQADDLERHADDQERLLTSLPAPLSLRLAESNASS